MWARKDTKRQLKPRWLAALGLSSMIRFDMSLLSADEAATYLHLNVKRVQALARSGRLPGRRVGRKWLFDERDLSTALGRAPQVELGGLELSARNQLRGRIVAVHAEG